MEDILELLHKSLFTGLIFTFISNAIVLLMRGKNNKARKTMGFIMLIWGLSYLLTLIGLLVGTPPDMNSLFRVKVIIIGHYFITFMFLFPMQVLVPGWLNMKKFLLLFLPIIVLTIMYYGIMRFLGQSPEDIKTYPMLVRSIGHFNVWFRFVFLLANFIYITIMLKWLYGYEKKYIQWKNENYSDQEYVDISWMRGYDILMVLIFIFYLGVLIFGGRIPVILHTIVVIVGFSYLFYKILFYESPYPEDFFATLDESVQKKEAEEIFSPLVESAHHDDMEIVSEQTFEDRIPSYIAILKHWMEEEKPYLYKDFKLTDVARVLPLNRSYLSRVFNEGFGHNFSEVVRVYRIEYSKEILVKNPAKPMYKVADQSGFNSDSSYIRAFKLVTGITPNQYKLQQQRL